MPIPDVRIGKHDRQPQELLRCAAEERDNDWWQARGNPHHHAFPMLPANLFVEIS